MKLKEKHTQHKDVVSKVRETETEKRYLPNLPYAGIKG